jgi:succinylglutamate desuccinylase
MDSRFEHLSFRAHRYQGLRTGPSILITGAVHGNETCGTVAIERLRGEIESGALPLRAGSLTLVPITNPLAYAQQTRNGDRNLNRNLQPTATPRDFEDHVANWLCPLMKGHDVLLDIHSTHASNPPFVMLGPRNNAGPLQPYTHEKAEREWALRLGPKRFVDGWLEVYAKGVQTRLERAKAQGREGSLDAHPSYGIGTTEYFRSTGGLCVTLECGSHADPKSPQVAYQAIRNTLAHFGLTQDPAPEAANSYEFLSMVEVIDRLDPADQFAKSWGSFDTLQNGEPIGTRASGEPVTAPFQGRILFPAANAQPGHEWFYLTRDGGRVV